jgi:hypothetical protein
MVSPPTALPSAPCRPYPLPAPLPKGRVFSPLLPMGMDHLSVLFAFCHRSSMWALPPARAAASATGRAPMSQRPRLRLHIIVVELEGHPRCQPSHNATWASSSSMTASHGQPSLADLRSIWLHPKLWRHLALLLGPGAGRPDPRPTPPLLFSLVKLMPPWRAVVGESPSSLQPTINSPTLPSRSSHHPAPPCRQLPPDWPATGADTALERASPVSPGGASPWAVGPATWAWLEASPCEQWDFLFSTGFYFNQFK